MFLKRNVLTIIYSFVFMILLGIGFVEVMFLAISSSSDRNVIACIIIIGIIIYLITAFLLKEKNKVQLIQVEKPMFQIVEACFVLSLLAFTFVLNQEAGFQDNLLVILLLGLLYGCARLLGGRLCGIMAAGTGFFLFFYLSSAGYEIRHAMDVICFLFPYFAFLLITKKVTHLYIQQPFLIIVSYLMLAVLFALASVLNPLVLLLMAGCVLSLLFGKTFKSEGILTSGPFCSFILLACVFVILTGVWFLMPDLSIHIPFEVDIKIQQMGASYGEIAAYLLKKYLRTSDFLYLTSKTDVFPSLLFFFAGLAGFYAIRKKSSSIGPLCFAYVGMLFYHMLFLGSADEFDYMFLILPVFSSYGIYNTLLQETPVPAAAEQEKTDPVPDETEEPSTVETGESVLPELLPAVKPVSGQETEPVSVPAAVQPEDADVLEKEKKAKAKKEKREKKKKTVQKTDSENLVPEAVMPEITNPAASDIPEWTASERFLKEAADQPERQEYNERQQYVEPLESEQPQIESKQEIEMDEELAQDPYDQEEEHSEAPLLSELESDTGLEPMPEESDPQTLEAFIPETLNTDEIDDSFRLVPEEPELSTEEEPALLSADHLNSDLNMADASNTLEGFSDVDNDADAQLNTLLNRLDISDNIRRMNESAREDIADIIERDDSENELHEAKPAEELDFEPHQPLPKYVKPEFDFEIEPVSQPLQDIEGSISEYDKVPTINDLERKWRDVNEGPVPRQEMPADLPEDETSAAQYSFAYSLEDIQEAVAESDPTGAPQIHSEEIVKKNGMNKRSYHKLTIG